MEFESIKKIVETEKEAQIIKEEACKKAKSILEKVEETKENNKGQLENRINDLKKEQKEANKQLISNITVASEEKVRKINSGLNENIAKAVEKIFEKVVKI